MKILVKAIAGSHLFGTDTPSSDTDYKGVYLPSAEDILLQKVKKTISIKTNTSGKKNTSEDVDIEYYSLHKYMQMLFEGQTVALELLWTPEDMILEKDPLWDYITSHRDELIHSKVTAFVGYCKTQADKYGVKGSRMAAAKLFIQYLETLNSYTKLSEIWEDLTKKFSNIEHINFGLTAKNGENHEQYRYIEVCNRKHLESVKVEYALQSVVKLYESYGERAKQAETNQGIDWKALSHAYRVCTQAIEILRGHKLTLPLPEIPCVLTREIKDGKLPFNVVKALLEEKVEEVTRLESESILKKELDRKKWCEDFVINTYGAIVSNTHKAPYF